MSVLESIELSSELIANLDEYIGVVTPEHVDLSKVKYYEEEFNKNETIQAEDVELLGVQTLKAMDLVADYAYVADRFAKHAHVLLDKAAATIYYTTAPAFITKSNSKDGDGARNKFIDQEPAYTNAKDLRDGWMALKDYLDNKYNIFKEKHYWVKKRIQAMVEAN